MYGRGFGKLDQLVFSSPGGVVDFDMAVTAGTGCGQV